MSKQFFAAWTKAAKPFRHIFTNTSVTAQIELWTMYKSITKRRIRLFSTEREIDARVIAIAIRTGLDELIDESEPVSTRAPLDFRAG